MPGKYEYSTECPSCGNIREQYILMQMYGMKDFTEALYVDDEDGRIADETRRFTIGHFSGILSIQEFIEEMDKLLDSCEGCREEIQS